LGLCPDEDAARVARHLEGAGLPTRIGQIPGRPLVAAELLEFIQQDKKVKRGALTFILTKGIGRAYISNDVSPGSVLEFLGEHTAK
jgi:3-dehydroquinate synthase